LSCDTFVANERYVSILYTFKCHAHLFLTFLLEEIMCVPNEMMWFCAACGLIQAALVELAVFVAWSVCTVIQREELDCKSCQFSCGR